MDQRSAAGKSAAPSRGNQRRAADRSPTCVGLRVEAPVCRVVVLGLAGRAHCETRHRSLRAVVGNAAGDGEARAAVGAVQEGIAIAAVGWVEQLAKAIGARRGVGGNPGGTRPRTSLATMRKPVRRPLSLRAQQWSQFAPGAGSRSAAAPGTLRATLGRPFNFDCHSIRVVADEAGQPFLESQAVDKGPKPTPCTTPRTRTMRRSRRFVRFSSRWFCFGQ